MPGYDQIPTQPGDLTPLDAPPAPPPKPKKRGYSWVHVSARASAISGVITLLVTILIIGAIAGFALSYFRAQPTAPGTKVQTLSPAEISKLTQVGTSLGSSGQLLNIGATTLFRQSVNVGGDLTVTGPINASGPTALSALGVTGPTAVTNLNVGGNLTVAGITTLQKSLTVSDLLTVNGGLNVSGSASVNALNASTIAVRTLSISGALNIAHLVSQGTAPTAASGAGIGAGGTVSISGNDTAGTININTGSGTSPGALMSVNFRAAYGATVHVILMPITSAAATTPVYITRSGSGFTVRTDSAAPTGAVLSYDYIVVQ